MTIKTADLPGSLGALAWLRAPSSDMSQRGKGVAQSSTESKESCLWTEEARRSLGCGINEGFDVAQK